MNKETYGALKLLVKIYKPENYGMIRPDIIEAWELIERLIAIEVEKEV